MPTFPKFLLGALSLLTIASAATTSTLDAQTPPAAKPVALPLKADAHRTRSPPPRARGSRSTCRPMGRRSSSTCSATSTRCRSPAARPRASRAGMALRRAAALLARRQAHRVRLRPSGRRQRLDHVARRQGHHAAHQGQRQPVRVAGVDARRQVRRRVAVGRTRRRRPSSGCITSTAAADVPLTGDTGRTRRRSRCSARPSARIRATSGSLRARATGSTTRIGPQYQLYV